MNELNHSLVRNRINLLFLSLPIFLLSWWGLGNYLYALVLGLGSAALIYVLFVWLPADKLQRNLRKLYFAETHKAIKTVQKVTKKITRTELKLDLLSAAELAEGLVSALEGEAKHQGKVEESLLPLLNNMERQIERWLLHESGRQPLSSIDEEKLLGIMLNYDTLFLKYQEGGLRSDEFLTSLYHSETAMLELGIDIQNPNLKEG